jgi:hypothetical protein
MISRREQSGESPSGLAAFKFWKRDVPEEAKGLSDAFDRYALVGLALGSAALYLGAPTRDAVAVTIVTWVLGRAAFKRP